jgi:hypothetical protein
MSEIIKKPFPRTAHKGSYNLLGLGFMKHKLLLMNITIE